MGDMFSSGQRLQQFIHDFLTFSVLETGELRMQYIEGDMNACLSEVCRLWSARFQERGLALYFLANEKLTPFAFDGPKIQRVISNLLENASKYTPQGGTVWLHAEPHMWERRAISKSAVNRDRRRQSLNVPNAIRVSVADTAREFGRSFIWKSSMISFAFPAVNQPREWAWDWRSPAACCKVWAEKSGLKVSRERAANFLLSFPSNQF